jgi:hypothetical protein
VLEINVSRAGDPDHGNSRADEKRREVRMVKVFKCNPVIDLFDTFTGKLGHGD